jgi:hypothetical protein
VITPRPGLSDPQLVLNEIYNPYSRSIFAWRDKGMDIYVQSAGIMLGPAFAEIPADSFLVLPHMYYRVVDYKGDLVNVLCNLGDNIGVGNKLASRPDFKLRD